MADQDDPNSIVSGPPKWRWPWGRAPDVAIGAQTRVSNSSVEAPEPARLPGFKRSTLPRFKRLYGQAGAPAPWKRFLVTVVLLAACLFHALPHVARMGGLVNADDARGLLVSLADYIPIVGGFDAAQWLVPAASGWLWQPFAAAFGAVVLRLVALNVAGRDPIGAIWIGVVALIVDTATWLFMGMKLQGAYTPAEAAALVTLLEVEAGALLVLFFILAPTGKKRFGRTDADWNGDN